MASAVRTKTADKQALLKKLHPVVKKLHKLPPIPEFPVLETMLFAVCLEDSSIEDGLAGYERLRASFEDLNEARVSSVTELQEALGPIENAEWKAYRYKGVLQHVFDKNYTFEFEGLKKRTLELAQKQLAKIKSATPFVRTFTLHAVLGAHLMPLDERSMNVLVWLGLANPGQGQEEVAESLKAAIKKAEVDQFSTMIRALGTDPTLRDAFNLKAVPVPEEGYDAATAMDRLAELMKVGSAAYLERLRKQQAAVDAAEAKQKDKDKKEADKKQAAVDKANEKAAAKIAAEKAEKAAKVSKATADKADKAAKSSGKTAAPKTAPVKSVSSQSAPAKSASAKTTPGKSASTKPAASKPAPAKTTSAKAKSAAPAKKATKKK
ncbi:MAG: hypothetical protein C0478_01845 [Planctomyces sp.]|nr:hypothetical protein [Planctomyces sp.]